MGVEEVFRLRAYWPSLPSSVEPVLYDGFRSHLPLRGSPGFSPGSLFRIHAVIQPQVIQPVTGDCVARRDGDCQVTSELQSPISFNALFASFRLQNGFAGRSCGLTLERGLTACSSGLLVVVVLNLVFAIGIAEPFPIQKRKVCPPCLTYCE